MRIAHIRPTGKPALMMHTSFACIYFLILVRAAVFLYDGSEAIRDNAIDRLLDPQATTFSMRALKNLSGSVIMPFYLVGFPIPPHWTPQGDLPRAIIMAILAYPLFHYGMFMNTTVEPRPSIIGKILDLCRAVFFVAGALLILIIVIRMGFMLYQDIAWSKNPLTLEITVPKK